MVGAGLRTSEEAGTGSIGEPCAFEKLEQLPVKATRISARHIGLFDARVLQLGRSAGRRQVELEALRGSTNQ